MGSGGAFITCLASGLARYANLGPIDMGLEYHVNYMVDGNVLLPLTRCRKKGLRSSRL